MAVAGCQSYDQTRGRGIVLRFNIRRWLELYQTYNLDEADNGNCYARQLVYEHAFSFSRHITTTRFSMKVI